MKKILAALITIFGMTVCAQDYENEFYLLLDNHQLDKAEAILSEWESKVSGDSELPLARFQLYMNQACRKFVVFENDTLTLDQAKKLAYAIGEINEMDIQTTQNDSLLAVAFKVIDNGIDSNPDRLDYRLAKISALGFIEEPEEMELSAIDILRRSRENNCRWLWSANEVIDNGEELMLENLHDIERELVECCDAEELLDLNLEYYPADAAALANKGTLAFNSGDRVKALEYMAQAHAETPEDINITFKLAYINMVSGNKTEAVTLYKTILENPDVNPEAKDYAKNMIESMNSELKEMRLYDFEYRFLPTFAAGVKPKADAYGLLCDIKYITGLRLARMGYQLPVDAANIFAEKFGEGDEAIVVWTMPMPAEIPLARYIAFLPDKKDNCFKVFTLEKSFNFDDGEDTWILGQINSDMSHVNLGNIVYPQTAENFAEVLRKRFLPN